MKKNYDKIFPDRRQELRDKSVLVQSQYVMLRILNIVADILEENGVSYWLDSGTLLGAIRHKGFIPWDDDVDIAVPYSEYERATKVLQDNLPKDLFLQTLETDEYYDLPWIKVKDNNSCILEYKPGKYHKGIYIDIFPVQEITSNSKKVLKARKNMSIKYRIISSNKEPFDKINSSKMLIKDVFKLFIKSVLFPLTLCSNKTKNKMIRNAAEKANRMIIGEGSGIIGYYGGIPFFNGKVSKSNIFPLTKVKFEGYEFYAPKEYDKYLTEQYGDYMTLPPEDERHFHNLNIIPDLKHKNTK